MGKNSINPNNDCVSLINQTYSTTPTKTGFKVGDKDIYRIANFYEKVVINTNNHYHKEVTDTIEGKNITKIMIYICDGRSLSGGMLIPYGYNESGSYYIYYRLTPNGINIVMSNTGVYSPGKNVYLSFVIEYY